MWNFIIKHKKTLKKIIDHARTAWDKLTDDTPSFVYPRIKTEIPDNGLRHAFATYHLSLYRNAPMTSILMRHRSPNMLWQHYLAGLVAPEVAAEYFAIVPKKDGA